MTIKPESITCPSCDSNSTYDAWYDLSNDYNAVCPTCNGVIDYAEFEKDTQLSNIA